MNGALLGHTNRLRASIARCDSAYRKYRHALKHGTQEDIDRYKNQYAFHSERIRVHLARIAEVVSA